MAIKNCWRKKRAENKKSGYDYQKRILTIKRQQKSGFKRKSAAAGAAAKHRLSTGGNWLLIIPCILREVVRLLPAWIYELFRFCPKKDPKTGPGDSFLVIGHRGAAAYEIENTIPSFEKALHQYGANSLEIDISMTADPEVVVWHDWDTDGMVAVARQIGLEPDVKYKPFTPGDGDKRKPAHELTLEELRDNYGYSLKKGKPKKVDAHIPTLREFFQWAGEQEKLRCLFLDVKTPAENENLVPVMMKEIKSLLDEFKPAFTVVFLTPEEKILQAMKTAVKDLNYSFDTELPLFLVLDPDSFGCVKKAVDLDNNFASIGRPPIFQLGPWTTYRRTVAHDVRLKKAHNASSEKPVSGVICWTLNRPREMKCLFEMGVDGIMTDKPDRLSEVSRGESGKPRRNLGY